MNKLIRFAAAGAAMASLGVATAAQAATQDSADVTAEILTALSVTVDATADTLNFGTIADGGISAPADIIVLSDGTRGNACPANLVCGGTVAAPNFDIEGLAGRSVQVSFVNATETLNFVGTVPVGTVGTLTAKDFTTSLTGNQVNLDTSGAATFNVGGTLTVAPNQAEGVYNGTVTVAVVYN